MPAPTKPKKTKKNHPADFHETAVPSAVPAALIPAVPSLNLTRTQLRAGIIGVWALAVILVGVALGLEIRARAAAPVAELPVPVAHAAVVVTGVATPPIAGVVADPGYDPATGNPPGLLVTTSYQPAGAADTLQPGFTHYTGQLQGAMGIARVPR